MGAARGFQQLELRVIMSLGQLIGSHCELGRAEACGYCGSCKIRQCRLMTWLSDRLRMYTLKRQTSKALPLPSTWVIEVMRMHFCYSPLKAHREQ